MKFLAFMVVLGWTLAGDVVADTMQVKMDNATAEYGKQEFLYITVTAVPARRLYIQIEEVGEVVIGAITAENTNFTTVQAYREASPDNHKWYINAQTGNGQSYTGNILRVSYYATGDGFIDFTSRCQTAYSGAQNYEEVECLDQGHALEVTSATITVPTPNVQDSMVLTSSGQSIGSGEIVTITATYTTGIGHNESKLNTVGLGVFLEYDNTVWEAWGNALHANMTAINWTFLTQLTPPLNAASKANSANDSSRYVEVWKDGINYWDGTKGIATFQFKRRTGWCGQTSIFALHPWPMLSGGYQCKTQSVGYNLLTIVSDSGFDTSLATNLPAILRTNVTVTTSPCPGGCKPPNCNLEKASPATTWGKVKGLFRD
jgi:hypothetical protein